MHSPLPPPPRRPTIGTSGFAPFLLAGGAHIFKYASCTHRAVSVRARVSMAVFLVTPCKEKVRRGRRSRALYAPPVLVFIFTPLVVFRTLPRLVKWPYAHRRRRRLFCETLVVFWFFYFHCACRREEFFFGSISIYFFWRIFKSSAVIKKRGSREVQKQQLSGLLG